MQEQFPAASSSPGHSNLGNRMPWSVHSLRSALLVAAFAPWFALAGNAAPESAPASSALEDATIAELELKLQSGALTSHALVQAYLDRIAAIDKAGPAMNAVIELNPDALRIADELDAERKSGKVRGPLHGIPVLIKDNIDTADRMHTTAGSLALADSIAAHDSTVAANLRKAGAVILGKTNLSE